MATIITNESDFFDQIWWYPRSYDTRRSSMSIVLRTKCSAMVSFNDNFQKTSIWIGVCSGLICIVETICAVFFFSVKKSKRWDWIRDNGSPLWHSIQHIYFLVRSFFITLNTGLRDNVEQRHCKRASKSMVNNLYELSEVVLIRIAYCSVNHKRFLENPWMACCVSKQQMNTTSK